MVERPFQRSVWVDVVRQRCCQPAPLKLGMAICLRRRHPADLLTCSASELEIGQ